MALYIGSLLQIALLSISSSILNDVVEHHSLGSQGRINHPSVPYDYIVIGSGAAGSVVASRLSEDPKMSVLLLEEGGSESVTNDIPAMDLLNVLQPTEKLFQFLVEPQTDSSQGFPDKNFNMITGRGLGGGSMVNGMLYNRGGKLDYDGWAKDHNATNWSYEDVLPYFKKSQDQQDVDLLKDSRYHSSGGPLTITSTDFSKSAPTYKLVADTLMKAAVETGFNVTDINGENQVGVGFMQRFNRKGRRHSTAQAFLQPASGRPNLHILTQARVTRILFSDVGSAYAVQFEYNGRIETVGINSQTGGEIILSAGAINSPKLLLLSGIGPRNDLEALGIPVLVDLPVGQNFHDHVRSGGADFVCEKPLFTFWQDLLTVENLEQFYVNGTGPLAHTFYVQQDPVINAQTSVPTRGALFGPSDIFIQPALVPPPFVLLTGGEPGLKKEILDKYYGPNFGKSTLNMYTGLNYVRSRGYIKLRSADPIDAPLVNPRYLTERDDVDRVIEAYKMTMKLGNTEVFKELGCKPYEQILPGCEDKFVEGNPLADDYVECKVRHLSASYLHPAGSCKMGGLNDPTSVVDPNLKVKGVHGLRVIDASIMPSVTTGNVQAPVVMIAEKGADLIKAERKALYSGYYYTGLQLLTKITPYFHYQYHYQ